MTAPIITFSRLRMQLDGPGVTTLVCFHGCPLRCRYCLNPFSFAPETKRTNMSPRQLFDLVRLDELYFLSTGGGVTFGGGEPLLYPDFIQEFRTICGKELHLCAETSLNVPWDYVRQAAACLDRFYVDCKDTAPEIYRSYTGQDNDRMLENLKGLLELVGPERITVRVPLIPDFNTAEDRQRSLALLTKMGIENFDCFTYRTSSGNRPSEQ